MSSSLNKVQLIGNLTADPEIRETPNGQKVASFSVATNRRWKDTNGVFQDEVEYHNVIAWRWLADTMQQYAQKGKKIYVEGYLKTRSWDDATGVKRYKTEIVSDNIILLSPSGNGGGYMSEGNMSSYDNAPMTDAKPARSKPKVEEEISIEDIPF